MAHSRPWAEKKTTVWGLRIGVAAQKWGLMGLNHMVTEMLEPVDSCQTLIEREAVGRLVRPWIEMWVNELVGGCM